MYAAWLQVSNSGVDVKAVVKDPSGSFIPAGTVVAKAGCWTMLKGGMTAYSSGPAELYFEVVDIFSQTLLRIQSNL